MALIGNMWRECDKTIYCKGTAWYQQAVERAENEPKKSKKAKPKDVKVETTKSKDVKVEPAKPKDVK
eukprot:763077-Hanusia_phi.AAC.1